MRKFLTASALTVAGLGLTAGAASASTVDSTELDVHNEHGNVNSEGGVVVNISDVATNLLAGADVLNDVDVL